MGNNVDPSFRQAVRWGADHPELGDLDVGVVDAGTAIGISAGRMPKPYPHLDPNEDATLAAVGPFGTLLAVADGHNGFDAARGAIARLQQETAILDQPIDDAREAVSGLLLHARQGVREALDDSPEERRRSSTALSVALLCGNDLTVGGWGDTQVLRIRGNKTRIVGDDGPFLKPNSPATEPTRVRLKDGDVVLVCSDGLRDYLGSDWTAHAAEVVAGSSNAGSAARALIEAAWAGGAGDHVAVALTQWEA